jgi:hypothetical protein
MVGVQARSACTLGVQARWWWVPHALHAYGHGQHHKDEQAVVHEEVHEAQPEALRDDDVGRVTDQRCRATDGGRESGGEVYQDEIRMGDSLSKAGPKSVQRVESWRIVQRGDGNRGDAQKGTEGTLICLQSEMVTGPRRRTQVTLSRKAERTPDNIERRTKTAVALPRATEHTRTAAHSKNPVREKRWTRIIIEKSSTSVGQSTCPIKTERSCRSRARGR